MFNRPRNALIVLMLVLHGGCSSCSRAPSIKISAEPPAPPREFRGVWVAAVANIDWPSQAGLSVDRQLSEMAAILDRAASLHLNAIILQVRPSCDALYPSALEPWSEYLTGRQGLAPAPFYDPLATWVREAHKRGLELHAWFNPYRARHISAKTPDAVTHVANAQPHIVRKFNNYEWLDPGDAAARQHTLNVILDVVRRYDIDGVHLDDYFYPYASQLKGLPGNDFPDAQTYQRYRSTGGTLARADWRRDNVNVLIRSIHEGVKAAKPHVKFGISPFGIWRPNHPPGVAGMDPFEELYADSKLWLQKGWCDYFTPQLYWALGAPKQPYAKLLRWWAMQNTMGRHLWPGNSASNVVKAKDPWPASEIVNQISATRADSAAGGNILFSMAPLLRDANGVSSALRAGPYAQPALIPVSPWMNTASSPLAAPELSTSADSSAGTKLAWRPMNNQDPWLWGVWARQGTAWHFAVHPGSSRGAMIARQSPAIDEVRVFAVDRAGNAGASARATIGK